MSELAKAVLAVQTGLKPVTKGADAQYGKYANYVQVMAVARPLLVKHGLVWTCHPQGDHLLWRLIHVASDEEWSGTWALPESANPQVIRSASTYGRRTCLEDVLDIVVEGADDDGQAAAEAPPKRTRAKIPGPDHERLREMSPPGPAERGPAAADPWRDQPPGQLATAPSKAGKGQHAAIAEQFRMRDIDDDDVRHGMLSQILGRPIESQGTLTVQDANKVLRWFRDNPQEES